MNNFLRMTTPQQQPTFFQMPTALYTLFLPLIVLLPLDYFLLTDNSILPWDQAHYAATALRVTATLTESPTAFARTILNPIPDRMPGLAWIAAPFAPLGSALANPARGVLLVTLILNNINLLLLSYILHKHGYAPIAHNAAIILAAGSTLLVGIGQTFFVEPLMLTGILWLIAMTRGFSFESPNATLHGLLPLLLAILAKAAAPVYLFVPLMLSFHSFISQNHSRRTLPLRQTISIHRTSLVLWLFFLIWLLKTGPAIIQRAAASSTGSLASLYGNHSGITAKASHWIGQLAIGTLPIPTLWNIELSIFSAISIIILALRYRHTFVNDIRHRIALFSLLQLLMVFFLFSLADNEDSRFLYGLLPYVLLIIATLVHSLSRPYTYIALALVGLQYLNTYQYVYGLNSSYIQLNTYLTKRTTTQEFLQNLQVLITDTCNDSGPSYYNIVAVDLPALNHNTMSTYSLLRSWPHLPQCLYTSLGYAESNPATALTRLVQLGPRYIIFPNVLPEYLDTDPFNRVSRAIHEELTNSPTSHYAPIRYKPYQIFTYHS